MKDDEGQGCLWEGRVDVVVVVDGVCAGEGVRGACPTNAYQTQLEMY